MRHVYKVPNTTHKYLIEDLSDTQHDTKYMNVPTEEKWRIGIMKELVKREISVPGISQQEMEYMLQVICSS